MTLPDGPLVAWVGDDFTGSAASMEALEFAGVPSVLFLDIPTPEQLARFPNVRGIGIATTARSQTPDWMRAHLPRVFDWLKRTGAQVVHYKVCSTFDSAPHVGSIGCAIDIAQPIVGGPWVPCMVAAPVMRRYQAFGHLFAGAPDGVFRLDRHPVMSRHPVTPMDESDLARHLSKQTDRPTACLDIEALERAPQTVPEAMLGHIVTLDAMAQQHMQVNGGLIWRTPGQVLAVGSQGVQYSLVEHWRASDLIETENLTSGAGPVDRMIAVSGSVSPTTAAQIDWAEAHGFAPIVMDAAATACGDKSCEDRALSAAIEALSEGRDPLIASARGPDDPGVARLRGTIANAGIAPEEANQRIGAALGRILARLLRETGIRRAVISGGDTSGHACAQLGLYAFTALAPTIPGAALLTAHSEDDSFNGLQLALKGGQMGSPDYFGWIKRGGGAAA